MCVFIRIMYVCILFIFDFCMNLFFVVWVTFYPKQPCRFVQGAPFTRLVNWNNTLPCRKSPCHYNHQAKPWVALLKVFFCWILVEETSMQKNEMLSYKPKRLPRNKVDYLSLVITTSMKKKHTQNPGQPVHPAGFDLPYLGPSVTRIEVQTVS